jgi:hypothetical protein
VHLFGGMLLIPRLRPRRLDGTGPKAIFTAASSILVVLFSGSLRQVLLSTLAPLLQIIGFITIRVNCIFLRYSKALAVRSARFIRLNLISYHL